MILDHKSINKALFKMGGILNTNDAAEWDALHNEWSAIPAVVVFPIGELIQPPDSGASGTIWAWKLQGKIKIPDQLPVVAGSMPGVEANGIEAMIRVDVNFMDALLFAQTLPPKRVLIECKAVTL